jgi:hypothetical protein
MRLKRLQTTKRLLQLDRSHRLPQCGWCRISRRTKEDETGPKLGGDMLPSVDELEERRQVSVLPAGGYDQLVQYWRPMSDCESRFR